jgi:ketosteroid isomerase-like protein
MTARTKLLRVTTLLGIACVGAAAFAEAQAPVGRRYRSLVDTERRFAAASVELGSRAAFRTYLTRDAIIFRPGPVNGWTTVAQERDDGVTLEWAPARVELSQAGDLGLTVGVWRRTGAGGARTFGRYVTLWQRTIEGSWRVTADIGTAAPGDVDWPASVEAGTLASRAAGVDLSEDTVDARLEALRAVDRAAARTIGDVHPAASAYRDGRAVVSGRDALANLASDEGVAREQVDAAIARSGDLGYTFGSTQPTGGAPGGYLRVWSRTTGGDWALLFDVVTGS